MTKIFSFFFFLLLMTTLESKAQDQLEKDIRKLHYTIDGFIQKQDNYHEERKLELILLILELDSNGAIKDMHLLGDNNNIDSSYAILQKMKPVDFGGRKFISWKNKILNLTIYSISDKEMNKTKRYSSSYVQNSIVHISSTIQSKYAVIVRPLYYGTPGKPIDEDPPGSLKIISDTKKKQ